MKPDFEFWSDLEIDALEIAGFWDERLHNRRPPPAA